MFFFFQCMTASLLETLVLNGKIREAYDNIQNASEPSDLIYIYFLKHLRNDEDANFYLMAAENYSPFFRHIYAHKAFFNFEISAPVSELAGIYSRTAKAIVTKYLSNRFSFHDKMKFEKIRDVPPVNYLINLIGSGDKKAEETYINSVLTGQIDPRNEIQNLKKLCETGNAKAMTVLGNLYLEGYGVEKCVSTAMHYFRQGAANGDPLSYNGLGKIFMREGHKDLSLAKKYFEEAASRGSAEGDYNLFVFVRNVYKIEDMGLSYLIRSVKRSYMPALFSYAKRLLSNGETASAVSHLVPICDFDDCIVDLQGRAQKDYREGRYVPCLYKLLFLCETGSLNSIGNLLYLLKTCKGLVPEQDTLFHTYCDKLAQMGQIHHLVDLADTYFYGKGTEQSYTKAFSFYYAAMLYKSARGSYALSYMYENGLGCTKSISDAMSMLYKAYAYDENTYLLVWYTMLKIYLVIISRAVYAVRWIIGCALGALFGYHFILKRGTRK
ncbi:Extracellular protein SEL-1 [Trachipleistophora hominis]|uniref:Extracellular protein SEL-1 n=1 Tax=Trachipleistophora hominis TaxID=72359 RepID=L7JSY2_TRAHO|nr:Extracellular protein SEL-1 [Trachipleistophora hominis]